MDAESQTGSGIFGGQSESYWENRNNRVRDNIYPSGLPLTLPDSTIHNPFSPSLIPGCSEIFRFVTNNPGDRTGGTPLHTDLCLPIGTPVEQCMVLLAGHLATPEGDPQPWYDVNAYCPLDGASIPLRLLARKWLVVGVDMPGLGDQPNPQVVVFNGSPVTPSPVHAYATGFSDGGPSPNQIYLNHIIKTLNQITASYGITRFSLVGHSGGANVAAMLAAMDSRLKNVQLLQGGWYQATNPDTDVETWIYNPAVELASFATTPAIHWMYTTAASMPHRMTVVHSSPTDPQYDFGEGAAAEFEHWKEWGTRVQEYFSNWASVTTRKKTGPGHGPDPDQAKFIEDCLLANAFNN